MGEKMNFKWPILFIILLSINSSGKDKMPTPVITPGDSTYAFYFNISIEFPNNKDVEKYADIWYTMDGSIPSPQNGILYQFGRENKIYDGGILKAISYPCLPAYAELYDPSEMATVVYFRKLVPVSFSSNIYIPDMFYDSCIVELIAHEKNTIIYYTLDGSTPDSNKQIYKQPLKFYDDVIIKAYQIRNDKYYIPSAITQYNLKKINTEINHPYTSGKIFKKKGEDEESYALSGKLVAKTNFKKVCSQIYINKNILSIINKKKE